MLGAALVRGQAVQGNGCRFSSVACRGFVRFRTELSENEQSEVLFGMMMPKLDQGVQLLTLMSGWPRICRSAVSQGAA